MQKEIKKLYRSNEERIVAGVCGGLGDYFKIDPIFIRLIFIFLALVNGLGVLFYIIFIFVIPKKGEKQIDTHKAKEKIQKLGKDVAEHTKDIAGKIEKDGSGWFKDKRNVVGILILIIGVFALLSKVVLVSWFSWDIFWRVALIIIGLYIVIKSTKKDNEN